MQEVVYYPEVSHSYKILHIYELVSPIAVQPPTEFNFSITKVSSGYEADDESPATKYPDNCPLPKTTKKKVQEYAQQARDLKTDIARYFNRFIPKVGPPSVQKTEENYEKILLLGASVGRFTEQIAKP